MRHTTSRTGTTNRFRALRRSHGPNPAPGTAARTRRHDRRRVDRNPRGVRADTMSDPISLVACTWLACGVVLLGMTPLPLHEPALGWSPAFWALAAPALVLAARRACAWRRARDAGR